MLLKPKMALKNLTLHQIDLLKRASGQNFFDICLNIMYTRASLLKILPKDSIGAELGVFKGEWTKSILKIVKPRKLHLIDPWWIKYGEYFPWAPGMKTSDAYNNLIKIIDEYDKRKVCTVHVQDDLVCLKGFVTGYFDWAYLDTTHAYEQTKKELEILKDKVKDDGIICGHDWQSDNKHRHHGVYKAVNEFCTSYKYKIIKLDRHLQWAIKKS